MPAGVKTTVLMSTKLHAQAAKLAKKEGLSVSLWLRRLAENKAGLSFSDGRLVRYKGE